MKIEKFHYTQRGWEGLEQAKELDSEKSLILVFFSPKFKNNEAVFSELQDFFPNTEIVGCSSSGEIAQDYIRDESLSCTIMQFESSYFRLEIQCTSIRSKILTQLYSQQGIP